MRRQKFKILEHSADLSLRVFGRDLPELFSHAVEALSEIAAAEPFQRERKAFKEKVEVVAPSAEVLLVDFLNEILTRAQINRAIYPKIKIIEFNIRKIKAEIFGQAVGRFGKDIKAVTYHGVKIKRSESGGYEVDLLFDV